MKHLQSLIKDLKRRLAGRFSEDQKPEGEDRISRREFGKLLGAGSAVGAGALVFSDAARAATRINTSSIDLDGGNLNNVGTVSGIDASDLSGSDGSSGQVLKTDGSSASWTDYSSMASVSDNGSEILSAPGDLDFGSNISVEDDGDGTVTITGTDTNASPGGNDGEIQINNSGSFAGDTNLYWDNTDKGLRIGTTSQINYDDEKKTLP